jgi:hypothetical protein
MINRHRGGLADALAWSSPRDGRWVLPLILIAYFSTLAALYSVRGWAAAWASLGVPAFDISFADARFIAAALDSRRLGFDPYVENPCDPWKRPMDYPRIWLALGPLGLTQDHTAIVGVGLAAAFFGSLLAYVGRPNPAQGLFLGLFLCSPHVMWGVERGNMDLAIFALLSSSLALAQRCPRTRPVLYASILASSILKLYPLAAMLALVGEGPRRALAWGLAITTACAAYFIWTWPDLILIVRTAHEIIYGTHRYGWIYGRMSVFDLIGDWLRARAGVEVPRPYLALSSLAAVGVAATAATLLARKARTPRGAPGRLDGFAVGSGIYIGTFLLGVNFEYKFVFLIFVIPLVSDWARDRGGLARPACLLLATIMLGAWTETLSGWIRHRPTGDPPASGIFLQEMANWASFVVLLAMNFIIIKERIGVWVRRPGRAVMVG